MNAITKATLVAVLVALGLALGAWAAEPPKVGETPKEQAKITHDWPCHTGPEGTFADPSKVPLLDDFSRAKLVWVSEHADLGWGKTYSGGGTACYPKTMAPSGSGSLIVAGGLVISAYFSPKNSTDADDIILALDAATGKTRWKQVFASKGANRGGGKHNVYGPTPAAADGKVYHLGTTARLYAVDLATGKPVWESDLGEIHKNLEALKAKAPVNENRIDGLAGDPMMVHPLIVIDGVVMVPVAGSLFGFDGAAGKLLWQIKSAGAVPCPAKLDGKMYALAQCDGFMQLIQPKTGEVLWKEFLGARFPCVIVADGRAFVPRAKSPAAGNPPPKGELPFLSAYALSERGAKLLWQSDFPVEGHSWHAYRDGVIYGSLYTSPAHKIKAFKAGDGTVLSQFDDHGGDRGRFHLWGDRIVVVGDNHHESLGAAPCYYWPLTPGVTDLKKSGRPYTPRNYPPYHGVCGYEFLMRDPFADGYQFTRAIDKDKAVGAIMCWDLRARPNSQWRKVSLEMPAADLTRGSKSIGAEVEIENGTVASMMLQFTSTSQKGEAGTTQARASVKEAHGSSGGRWKGLMTVDYGFDPEEWQFDLDVSKPEISGAYQRTIAALPQAVEVEGTASATQPAGNRWVLILDQAISPNLSKDGPRRNMHITVDQSPDGKPIAWAWMSKFNGATPEIHLERFDVTDKSVTCKAVLLAHSDIYLCPSTQRRGTVAVAVDVALTPAEGGWKGTYKLNFGAPYAAGGAVQAAKP